MVYFEPSFARAEILLTSGIQEPKNPRQNFKTAFSILCIRIDNTLIEQVSNYKIGTGNCPFMIINRTTLSLSINLFTFFNVNEHISLFKPFLRILDVSLLFHFKITLVY